jgi:hypothetical protein
MVLVSLVFFFADLFLSLLGGFNLAHCVSLEDGKKASRTVCSFLSCQFFSAVVRALSFEGVG